MLKTQRNQNFTSNQLQALDSSRNVAVRANAGSGKTSVLVDRILQILNRRRPENFAEAFNPEENFTLEAIVSITFTRKAAGELRCRLTELMTQQVKTPDAPPEEKAWWANRLKEIASAPIGTIDSFCARVLREFTLLDTSAARIDPDFTMLSEYETGLFHSMAFQALKQHAEADREGSPLAAAWKWWNQLEGETALGDCLESLLRHPAGANAILAQNPEVDDLPDAVEQICLQQPLLVKVREGASNLITKLQAIVSKIQATPKASNTLVTCKDNCLEVIKSLQPKSHGALEDTLTHFRQVLCTAEGKPRGLGFYNLVQGEMAGLQKEWALLLAKFSFSSAVEARALEGRNHLRILLQAYQQKYFLLCQEANSYDFDTVARKVLFLLKTQPGARGTLKKRHPYFQIDEFQDTSALQWEILALLVSDDKGALDKDRLFIVGDPQQSIFGFRNADVAVFKNVEDLIQTANQDNNACDQPLDGEPVGSMESWLPARGGLVNLPKNFRTLGPAPLHFINRVIQTPFNPRNLFTELASTFRVPFSALDQGLKCPDPGEVIYLDASVPGAVSNEQEKKANNSPENKGDDEEEDIPEALENQAHMILDEFTRLKGQPRKKPNHSGQRPPLSWKDMAVLFPSRTKILPSLSKVFRQRGVPFIVTGGIGFWERQEIRDLLQLANALASPGDDLALFCVLRGPCCRLNDQEIFFLHFLGGGNFSRGLNLLKDSSPELANACDPAKFLLLAEQRRTQLTQAWGLFDPASRARLAESCQRLALRGKWRQRVDRLGHADLLRLCLEETGAWAIFASWEDGPQSVGNVRLFLDMVLSEEEKAGATLMRVAQYLAQRSDQVQRESQASLQSADADAVQLMTIHAAKGLEFPVVALAKLEKKLIKARTEKVLVNAKGEMGLKVRLTEEPLLTKGNEAFKRIKIELDQRNLAEAQRLLYVGMTRAEEVLILAASNPKKNLPDTWKNWLEASQELSLAAWEAGSLEVSGDQGYVLQLRSWKGPGTPLGAPTLGISSSADIGLIQEFPTSKGLGVTSFEDFLEEFQKNQGGWQLLYGKNVLLHHGGLRQGWPEKKGADNKNRNFAALLGRVVHRIFERFQETTGLNSNAASEWVKGLVEAEIRLAAQEDDDEDETRVFTEEEKGVFQNEAMQMVRAAQKEPIATLARACGPVEADFILPLGAWTIQGRMDKLIRQGKEWEIVDWKTDSGPVEKSLAHHRFQMQLYALALLRSGILPPEQKEIRASLVLLRHEQVKVMRFTRDELQAWEKGLVKKLQEMKEALV